MTIRPPLVTLLVPIRNERPAIDACLGSIAAQDYPTGCLETIVIDGDSDDGTVEAVEAFVSGRAGFQLLSNPSRAMPHGLNIGIDASSGEYIGAVSGHSELPPDYVSRMVATMEKTGAWSAGVRIERIARSRLQRAIAIATASPIGVGDSRHNYGAEPGWVESAFPGFWRRETFSRVGPFDPDMLVNEDNELSYRIRKAGGRIWYDPSTSVEYVPRSTLSTLFTQYHNYARGKVRVLRKHRGGLRWRHAVPALWVAFFIAGGMGALIFTALLPWWLAGLGVYGVAVTGMSIRLASDDAPWWLIAAAIATLHLSYGTGLWRGLLEATRR